MWLLLEKNSSTFLAFANMSVTDGVLSVKYGFFLLYKYWLEKKKKSGVPQL